MRSLALSAQCFAWSRPSPPAPLECGARGTGAANVSGARSTVNREATRHLTVPVDGCTRLTGAPWALASTTPRTAVRRPRDRSARRAVGLAAERAALLCHWRTINRQRREGEKKKRRSTLTLIVRAQAATGSVAQSARASAAQARSEQQSVAEGSAGEAVQAERQAGSVTEKKRSTRFSKRQSARSEMGKGGRLNRLEGEGGRGRETGEVRRKEKMGKNPVIPY